MADLVLANLEGRSIELQTLARRARDYVDDAKAPNTTRAYRSDWNDFVTWCGSGGLNALPAAPTTIALYLTSLADRVKPSTIQRRISAISQAHQAAGIESPTKTAAVRGVWAGIRRAKGTAQQGKAALLTADLRDLIDCSDDTLCGIRDRAVLLLGFAGAFRRAELVALDLKDLEFSHNGLTVRVRRSKTDQDEAGDKKGIPFGSTPGTCPVRAVQLWIDVAGLLDGPIFRPINRHGQVGHQRLTPQSVALIIKKLARASGRDASAFSGHSLRAGMATQAAISGASERAIMRQTGYRSLGVVRRYIRDGNLFRDNAATALGL